MDGCFNRGRCARNNDSGVPGGAGAARIMTGITIGPEPSVLK